MSDVVTGGVEVHPAGYHAREMAQQATKPPPPLLPPEERVASAYSRARELAQVGTEIADLLASFAEGHNELEARAARAEAQAATVQAKADAWDRLAALYPELRQMTSADPDNADPGTHSVFLVQIKAATIINAEPYDEGWGGVYSPGGWDLEGYEEFKILGLLEDRT